MTLFLMTIAALLTLAVAAYAQHRVPRFTEGSRKVMLTRAILIVIGVAFGLLSAASYPNDPVPALLAFAIGFGMVHVPAAFILFIKQERGMGKS